jgi:hypothetical protein
VRLKRFIGSLVVITTSAVVTSHLDAQGTGPEFFGLTRGATHETRTLDLPGLTAANSRCPVSDDPTYGVTAANPIKVGGSPMYVKARSMRFLLALRGPAGQGLHFKRLGSFDGPHDTILDLYEVERDGVVRHLYLDGYRTAGVWAPPGFVCGDVTQPS